MDASLLLLLSVLFVLISFLYGSVGLGGGSAYIAAMVMLGMNHAQIPILALALNLVVAGSGLAHFSGGGHFRARLFLALVPTSVPAAYLAAQVVGSEGSRVERGYAEEVSSLEWGNP